MSASVFHIRFANSWFKQNKKILSTGKKDVSTRNKLDWLVVRTNKDCISAWMNAIPDIITYDSTLRQSIR